MGVRINQSRACVITEGEMLKFLGCLLVALGAVLSIPMEMTTMRPEATTEDTSGRLLSLPDPVKCSQRPKHFEHGDTTTGSLVMKKTSLTTKLTGWTGGTSAGST